MPRKKYNPTVNYTSPDGLPAGTPPLDEEGNVIDPPEPDEDDVDYDYDQFDHE